MDKLKTLPVEVLLGLNLSKNEIELANSKLEIAKQQKELAIMNFKYNLLSTFHKFGLPEDCKIQDDGTIVYPDENSQQPE